MREIFTFSIVVSLAFGTQYQILLWFAFCGHFPDSLLKLAVLFSLKLTLMVNMEIYQKRNYPCQFAFVILFQITFFFLKTLRKRRGGMALACSFSEGPDEMPAYCIQEK
jgi:hypothetical protein